MDRHNRQHAGFSTQAKRRGEQMLMCSSCGQLHPRYQARPVHTGQLDGLQPGEAAGLILLVVVSVLAFIFTAGLVYMMWLVWGTY